MERIKEAVTTLVTELADYDDVDPGTAPLAKASLAQRDPNGRDSSNADVPGSGYVIISVHGQ